MMRGRLPAENLQLLSEQPGSGRKAIQVSLDIDLNPLKSDLERLTSLENNPFNDFRPSKGFAKAVWLTPPQRDSPVLERDDPTLFAFREFPVDPP